MSDQLALFQLFSLRPGFYLHSPCVLSSHYLDFSCKSTQPVVICNRTYSPGWLVIVRFLPRVYPRTWLMGRSSIPPGLFFLYLLSTKRFWPCRTRISYVLLVSYLPTINESCSLACLRGGTRLQKHYTTSPLSHLHA